MIKIVFTTNEIIFIQQIVFQRTVKFVKFKFDGSNNNSIIEHLFSLFVPWLELICF